ncbi:hypothetical protein KPL71_025438 [Citrus sinensis]|uniref:Uncharacterized protein n=1 Tax=Citrus sinensis TaxID=2711 RepID=A0ACB8HS77_CITSI|nr:hypothetical protein KPL71_025438 [Citrus sinensis]
MASHLGGLIRDQNLNAHLNGASAGGKSTISKVPKKGALGGRKPLGDLSNSVNPTPNQSLKKQNSNVFSDNVIGASKSKIKIDGSKKKSFSRAPEKLQTSGRKALSDISNSGKSHLHEAPKKNFNPKLSVLTEEDLSAIAEEGYLHNHQECIKAQTKSMDIDELLRTVGLDKGFPKQAEPPQLSKVMVSLQLFPSFFASLHFILVSSILLYISMALGLSKYMLLFPSVSACKSSKILGIGRAARGPASSLSLEI